MDRLIAKIISLVVTFVVIFICMALPIKVSQYVEKQKNSKLILSLLRCMAGGVFLGTVFTHMIPEANHMLEHGLYDHHHIHYPVGEVILLAGFFFICFFEKTVLTIHKKKTQSPPEGVVNKAYELGKSDVDINVEQGEATPSESTEADNDDLSMKRSLVLVLALAFECVFDGLGIGTQRTTHGTWMMFIGVISHEFIIAFCLGIELIKHHSPKRVLLAAFGYSIIPAIGISIGMIVTENPHIKVNGDTLDLISGILIAFAAGIFVSCTFLGVLGDELVENSNYKKLIATMVGCAIMVCLAAIPHEHEHDHGHDHDVTTTTEGTVTASLLFLDY